MALLLANNYKPETFNKVPLFHKAVESLKSIELTPTLKQLGELFVNYGVNEKYSLILIHRHFELKPNEIVIESSGEITVAFPWILKGNKVDNAVNPEYKTLVNVDLPRGKIVTPQTWAFSTNGELSPIEFAFKTDAHDHQPLVNNSKFVTELFGNLKAFGLETVFGIGIRNSKVGWESTDMVNRANIVQYENFPKENDVKLVNVQWAFNNRGGYIENQFCIYVIIDGVKIHKRYL